MPRSRVKDYIFDANRLIDEIRETKKLGTDEMYLDELEDLLNRIYSTYNSIEKSIDDIRSILNSIDRKLMK